MDEGGLQTFGAALRVHRLAAGLSQEALAARAGLSTRGIKFLERGNRRPFPDTIRRLADALALAPETRAGFAAAARHTERAHPEPASEEKCHVLGPHPISEVAGQDVALEIPAVIEALPFVGVPADPGVLSLAAASRPSSQERVADLARDPLPVPLTPLLGRDQETAAVLALLADGYTRLLTLTGPGGVGKTRLALQVGQKLQAQGRFADGVTFVSLAPLRDADLVLPTLAQQLKVPETPDLALRERLSAALYARHLLLVLDNCEHLPPAAPLLADLLVHCPRLIILATSRGALNLRGEQIFPVLPLALPTLSPLPSLEILAQSAAVALFVQRARAAVPDFVLNESNAGAVAAICTRLDGLPLAIELAAARVALLPPAALLARLYRRLAVLVDGPHDLPERQQTLQATLAWSYDLLQDGERALFRHLAVFAGNISLRAIESVCFMEDGGKNDILSLLSGLVHKSLLQPRPDIEEPYFAMLETVREYGLEQLTALGERDEARARHAAYYVTLTEHAGPRLRGAEQDMWIGRLELQHEDLRAAMEWSLEHEATVAAGTRIAGSTWWFWYIRGYLDEGRAWLDNMEARSRAVRTPARACVLLGAGVMAWRQRDYNRAAACFQEAEALCRSLGTIQERAFVLNVLAAMPGDPAQSRILLHESLALSLAGKDTWSTAFSLYLLGGLAASEGNVAEAEAHYEETLTLVRSTGDKWGLAATLASLGSIAQARGDFGRARTLLMESLTLSREHGYTAATADPLRDLARLAQAQGDDEASEALFAESAVACRHLGDSIGRIDALVNLGWINHRRGDAKRAGEFFSEGMDLSRNLGDGTYIAACLEGMAGVALATGQPVIAATMLGAADALSNPAISTSSSSLGITPFGPPLHGNIVGNIAVAVREQLDREAFAAAFAEGRAQPSNVLIIYGWAKQPA